MNKNFIIGLASNVDDKELNLEKFCNWFINTFSNVEISKLYNTKALNVNHNDYLNGVASADTDLTATQLNTLFKEYEKNNGRTHDSKVLGQIPIDIDVVVYNNEILRPIDFKQSYFLIGYNEIKSK